MPELQHGMQQTFSENEKMTLFYNR